MMLLKKIAGAFFSALDPRVYVHGLRVLHYYNYAHVKPRRLVRVGERTTIAPNVSLANGERITIGSGTKVGERCFLWAGDSNGRIAIGDGCRLAPDCFLTASDYGAEPGQSFLDQPRREADIVVGDHVWLGAGVFVAAGVTIGDHCIVGAHAVVTKSLPANSIAVGVPARVVKTRDASKERAGH